MIRYDIHRGAEKIKTKTFLAISGLGLVLGGGAMSLAILGSAHADTNGQNFENPPYTVGNINGQDGWSKTGAFDAAVVANTYSIPSFGAQTLRVSDSVTSGSFGDQTFAKPLVDAVGETDSTNGAFTAGTKQQHFDMQFDISSALSTLQTGMHMSVSPDRGDGSRMSYLRFEDQGDGIHVYFDDVQGTTSPVNFVETDIATITRDPHTIRLTLDTLDGASNDVVKIWIDGSLKITGTSWENYYRYDAESASEQTPRIVKTILIRESGTATPADAGAGFLIDNLTLKSSAIPTVTAPSITTPPTGSYRTPAQLTMVDWNDPAGAVLYQYRSYTNSSYNTLAYDSGMTLTASQIPTPGTPVGDYYLQVRAQDADGNVSPWSNDAITPYVVHVVNLLPPPTTKDDCRNDGWKTFNNPSLRNKDKCIDYYFAHGHKVKGEVTYTAYNLKRSAEFEMNTYDNNKGNFEYSDTNHGHYKVKISSVKVNGQDAWFAGAVTNASDSSWIGQWLFAKVQDNNPDQISGSFTTQTVAEAGVNAMTNPGDGPFNVTKGNLKVN